MSQRPPFVFIRFGDRSRSLAGRLSGIAMAMMWVTIAAKSSAFAQTGRAAESYPIHPDSQRTAGVPRGKITKHTFDESKIYPGTSRDYWVYVPEQYDAGKSTPACLMVFQDGGGAWQERSQLKSPIVFDNLIHAGEMPVTIGVFVAPGVVPATDPQVSVARINRQFEYDAVNDRYASFLLDELLPAALKGLNVSDRPGDRGIAGGSSGGIAAFNVAWQRPDAFRRVFCWVGTFVGLRGGNEFAALVRKTEPKPLRVFLQDGSKDLNTYNGSWWVANQGMLSALTFSGYEVEHLWGEGYHGSKQAAAIMPDALRWLWKTWPEAPSTHYEKSMHQDLTDVLIEGEGWELIAEGMGFTEGPAIAPDGSLFFTDLETSRIYRIRPGDRAEPEVWLEQSGVTNGLAFDKEGRLYGCRMGAGQVVRWNVADEEMEVLVEDVKPNDVVVAHDGTVYFTEPRKKQVWCIPAGGGTPFVAAKDYSGVNGVALSPDQSFVYAADYSGRYVWSAQRVKGGMLVHNQPFYHLNLPPASIDIRSQADGMCVDRDGWLLVATAMGVQCFEPRGMVHLILPPPPGARHPANICFAADGSTLIATCGDKVYRRRTKFHVAVHHAPPVKPKKRKW